MLIAKPLANVNLASGGFANLDWPRFYAGAMVNGNWSVGSMPMNALTLSNAMRSLQLRAVQREDPWQRSPGSLVSFCDVCIRRIYRKDYGLLNGHCPTTLFKAQYTSKRST